MKLYTEESKHKGYTIRISIHRDEHMGPPWKEHDGHGIVSDREHRDKRPGEIILHSDRQSKWFYDFAGTMAIAKRDGWGLSEENIAKLEKQLGRKPTKGDVLHAAAMRDYEHLKGWCNDEWCWVGYTTEIETPDGETIEGDSCWGYDDEKYMLEEAIGNARQTIQEHRNERASEIRMERFERKESAYLACADIATV